MNNGSKYLLHGVGRLVVIQAVTNNDGTAYATASVSGLDREAGINPTGACVNTESGNWNLYWYRNWI